MTHLLQPACVRIAACLGVVALLLAAASSATAQGELPPSPTPDWATPKRLTKLAPHPRLFVTPAQLERVKRGRGPAFEDSFRQVAAAAETGLRDAQQPMADVSPFQRGFVIQGRLTSLAIQFHRTGDRRYLDAAVATITAMQPWLDPLHEYSLEHGQYIAGIAVVYDLLRNDLTPEQRATLVDFARGYCIRPFLRLTGRGRQLATDGERGSWWQHVISNWNPVCNSGPGMLALTMYEDLDEAQTVLDRVEESFEPIIDYLQESEGGWVEGLGYWNWTIHYMSLFYLSHERATGLQHAGFRSPGFRATLAFGPWFVPYDEACGFGDNQHGGVSSSLLAAAEHLGELTLLRDLQEYQARLQQSAAEKAPRRAGDTTTAPPDNADRDKPTNVYYGVPQDLLILPDVPEGVAPSSPRAGVAFAYPEQGWGVVADRWPRPNVYAAIRGGELGGAHTHDDLLSWHGVVGGERMILSQFKAGYYSTSWEWRAKEVYERNAASKNTLFIAGVSAYSGEIERRGGFARAIPSTFDLPTGPALRLNATRAFPLTRGNPRLVARLFTVLGDRGLLVLDRVETPGANPVEVRTHTDRKATFGERDVRLEGTIETARLTFAADRPAVLRAAVAMLTDARAEPPTVMRWQTLNQERAVTMASLLSRGGTPVDLQVTSGGGTVTVTARGDGWDAAVRLTDKLEPLEAADDHH